MWLGFILSVLFQLSVRCGVSSVSFRNFNFSTVERRRATVGRDTAVLNRMSKRSKHDFRRPAFQKPSKIRGNGKSGMSDEELLLYSNISRNTKNPFFFIHIHKAGGTTISALARANQWQQPNSTIKREKGYFSKNMNPSSIDAVSAIWSSADKMTRYAYASGLDIWATEWWVPTELPNQSSLRLKAKVILLLRHPTHLLFSMCWKRKLIHETGDVVDRIDKSTTCLMNPYHSNYITQRLAACSLSWRNDPKLAFLQVNNYTKWPKCETAAKFPNRFYIFPNDRIKPNEEAANGQSWREALPPPEMTRLFNSSAMLQAAKKRLDAIDHILITEKLDQAGPILRQEFNWKVWNSSEYRAGTRRNTLDVIKKYPNITRIVEGLNTNDMALYEYACELFEIQLREATLKESLHYDRL